MSEKKKLTKQEQEELRAFYQKEFLDMQRGFPGLDSEETGKKLFNIRSNDLDLKKHVCRFLFLQSMTLSGRKKRLCKGCLKCEECTEFDSSISQAELAEVFFKEGRSIYDLEKGKSITLEKLLMFSYIAKEPLHTLLSLASGYAFDENGCVIRIPEKPKQE